MPNTTTTSTVEVCTGADSLPPGVGELLGREATERFDAGDDNALVIGAVEEGRWVAAVLLLIDDSPVETVGSLRQLVIPPTQRGKGVAGRLIHRALEAAAARGATRLRSTAGWGCPDHLALYRRLKFDNAGADERPYLVTRNV